MFGNTDFKYEISNDLKELFLKTGFMGYYRLYLDVEEKLNNPQNEPNNIELIR